MIYKNTSTVGLHYNRYITYVMWSLVHVTFSRLRIVPGLRYQRDPGRHGGDAVFCELHRHATA